MSDGKRVPTRAWTFTATGGMSRNDDDLVAIEEAAPISASAAPGGASEPAAPREQESRSRRSTLETFNDEMAALDRPLDGEVEYFEEKPPARWPRVAGFIAIVAIVGVGGSFLISRHRAAAETHAQATQPSPPASAGASPLLAAQTAAPVRAPAAAVAEAPTDEPAAGDDSASPAAGSRAAWGKVRNKAGSAKHARSSSSKTTHHHRSTTKRSAAGKRPLQYH